MAPLASPSEGGEGRRRVSGARRPLGPAGGRAGGREAARCEARPLASGPACPALRRDGPSLGVYLRCFAALPPETGPPLGSACRVLSLGALSARVLAPSYAVVFFSS